DTYRGAQQVVGAGYDPVGLQAVPAMTQRKVAEPFESPTKLRVVVRIDTEVLVERIGHPGAGLQQGLRGCDHRVYRVVFAVVDVADEAQVQAIDRRTPADLQIDALGRG